MTDSEWLCDTTKYAEMAETILVFTDQTLVLEKRLVVLVARITTLETRIIDAQKRDDAKDYVKRMKERIEAWSGELADEPEEHRFAVMLYDVLMFKARFPGSLSIEAAWKEELRKGLQGARCREGWTSGKLRTRAEKAEERAEKAEERIVELEKMREETP